MSSFHGFAERVVFPGAAAAAAINVATMRFPRRRFGQPRLVDRIVGSAGWGGGYCVHEMTRVPRGYPDGNRV